MKVYGMRTVLVYLGVLTISLPMVGCLLLTALTAVLGWIYPSRLSPSFSTEGIMSIKEGQVPEQVVGIVGPPIDRGRLIVPMVGCYRGPTGEISRSDVCPDVDTWFYALPGQNPLGGLKVIVRFSGGKVSQVVMKRSGLLMYAMPHYRSAKNGLFKKDITQLRFLEILGAL
ncbi:hypothetical protein MRY87_06660 [bacterium]|nr:hypothetical protein [bacterium]